MQTNETITLNNFEAREYQKPLLDAIFNKGYKRIIAVMPRRSGKDYTLWQAAIRQCLMKTCMVMYVLPSFGSARRSIFDAIDINGQKFLDMIPLKLIKKINSAEMKITFINDSILLCIGGESHATSIRGTNPYAVILSEFAYMEDGQAILDTVMPILAANDGWLAIASTPYGKNHYYQLFNIAKTMPGWFVYYKTVHDTNHIPQEALDEERSRMSEGMFNQEYECSFDMGIDGSIFGAELQKLKDKGQITSVAWDPGLVTYLAIDIGVSDATTIVWFQVVGDGTLIRVIDCYSNTGKGLDHYAKIIQDKPYRYSKMFAPHDLKVREWAGGALTRYEKARQLDLNFTILDQIAVADSIENALTHFPKIWIDRERCKSLIDALENYHREYDAQRGIYKNKPVHDKFSNYADAFRYMCQAIYKTRNIRNADEYEKIRNEALYGKRLPKIFQYDPRYDR